MMIEVSVEGNRTLVNMDTVIGVTENGDTCDVYTPTGVIAISASYDDFLKLFDPDNRKVERWQN